MKDAILAAVTNTYLKIPTEIERLRAYISRMDGQREDQVNHVVAFKGGQVLLERTDPLWTQPLIYAFAASGAPHMIWYLGHSGNPSNRLQPSLDEKSFGHPRFARQSPVRPRDEFSGTRTDAAGHPGMRRKSWITWR